MFKILQFPYRLLKKFPINGAIEIIDDLFGIMFRVIIVVYFIYSSVVANSYHFLFLVFIHLGQGYGL